MITAAPLPPAGADWFWPIIWSSMVPGLRACRGIDVAFAAPDKRVCGWGGPCRSSGLASRAGGAAAVAAAALAPAGLRRRRGARLNRGAEGWTRSGTGQRAYAPRVQEATFRGRFVAVHGCAAWSQSMLQDSSGCPDGRCSDLQSWGKPHRNRALIGSAGVAQG